MEAVKTQWSLLCATLNLRVLYKKWQARHGGPPKMVAEMVKKLEPSLGNLVR